MAALILFGNPNQYTFANSIVAANHKATMEFSQPLKHIFVIHSQFSKEKLDQYTQWQAHIQSAGIGLETIIEKTIDITPSKDSIFRLADYIEIILKGVAENHPVMVDFANGTSLQKNLLAVTTYILDLQNQYMIDIVQLAGLTDDRGFLPTEILEKVYISVPDSKVLDNIAYLSLSEMIRYKKSIKQHAGRYQEIDPEVADMEFFSNNFLHSVEFKLKGDRQKDNAIYRIAASSIAVNLEEVVTLLINKYIPYETASQLETKTFGNKLKILERKLTEIATPTFDLEFLQRFNEIIRYLRNSSTHKARFITDLEKFKAQLSVSMAFSFIEFYIDIISPILEAEKNGSGVVAEKENRLLKKRPVDTQQLYYGLDGDDTGAFMEDLLVSSKNERDLRQKSDAIKEAIKKVCTFIKSKSGKNAIIFDAGDDCLFKGTFTEQELSKIQKIYYETCGLTCSIGIGRSFQEVYLALKLAKARPGKHSIVSFVLDMEI